MRRNWVIFAVAAITGLGLAAAVTILAFKLTAEPDNKGEPAADARERTPIEQALWMCDGDEDTIESGDGGHTIIIDTANEYGSVEGIECVMEELGTSDAIRSQMSSTTAMMGTQTAEQDGLAYSWSYHPDNGVNMTITEVD